MHDVHKLLSLAGSCQGPVVLADVASIIGGLDTRAKAVEWNMVFVQWIFKPS
jgi:hypothetical protein